MPEPALALISVDGLSAVALADPSLRLPALRALAARGVQADGLRPVFPSVTWPCHASLITGVSPARHGVLGNHVLDRGTRRIVSHYGDRTERPLRVESLLDVSAQAGLTTAAICWPKTRGMDCVVDNIPEFYEQALFERHASRPLWDELIAAGLPVERYGEWSATRMLGHLQDWLSLEVARHLLRRRPPDVLLLHFLLFDTFQHEFGVGSRQAGLALEYVDGLIGRFVDELDAGGRLERTALVVVGDHGFLPVERLALPNAALRTAGLVRPSGEGEVVEQDVWVVGNGGGAHVYVADGPRRPLLVEHAREVLASLPGVAEVIESAVFPELGLPVPAEDPTQGDLMLTATVGWHFADDVIAELAESRRAYRGTHGHRPDDPRLLAGFVAAGPSIAEGGRVGVLSHLDVAPTLAALLGLKLAAAEHGPVWDLLDAEGLILPR